MRAAVVLQVLGCCAHVADLRCFPYSSLNALKRPSLSVVAQVNKRNERAFDIWFVYIDG